MEREGLRSIFAEARVGIAGAGGLGSTCAVSLARAGVRRLVVADFDTITEANLDRQYYFLDQVGRFKVDALSETIKRIDPRVELTAHRLKLDSQAIREIFAGCDIIVEAVDNAGAKSMVVETALEAFPAAHLVCASGLAGIGNLGDLRQIHRGRLHLCGDFERETSEASPPVAPRVGIVANMEADMVLQILLTIAESKRWPSRFKAGSTSRRSI
jgi:sulfur carrier protein ThiS adenylyltransferase